MVTDSPPSPFMILLSVWHAFSGVELAWEGTSYCYMTMWMPKQ